MRVLYIHATVVPPSTDRRRDPFFLLSERLEGDVLQPIWFEEGSTVDSLLGVGSYPVYQSGRFRYHWFLSGRGFRRSKLASMWFYVSKGLQIFREKPYDCVVTYSHMATGLCGVILKLLTRAKLIVEVTTSPGLSYAAQHRGVRARIMDFYSNLCLHICLWSCDRAQLRGPGLLASFRMLRNVPTSILPGFVPMSLIPPSTSQVAGHEKSVVLVGAPWFLKGADVLVKAFRRLSPDFPDVKLKILGHYPDRAGLEALTSDCPQIEIMQARPNPEVISVIVEATVFALPSRCEGTPRVVLEAMAAGVPVIGSDVGGIPYVVRDGLNGFIVPVEDDIELEARLRQLLADGDLRKRMGAFGYELAHAEFDEKAYVGRFARAVQEVLMGAGTAQK